MFRRSIFSKIAIALVMVALIAGTVVPGFGSDVASAEAKSPKYVFYFIGDGLGAAQRSIAENYYKEIVTDDMSATLNMNTLPVVGMNTTYSADTLVTDSAAAGTALATGKKTNNKMISVSPDGNTDYRTLVEEAEAKGMGTGLITTTRLTHATPATFASHNVSRYNANEIAVDFVESGVDFFAGGGLRYFIPQGFVDVQKDAFGDTIKSKRKDNRNLIAEFANKGYNTYYGEMGAKDFDEYTPDSKDKVFAAFTYSHLPYEIDRINNPQYNAPSIADMTQKAIDTLSWYENGFFMMVEGGRIDHACHANDAGGSIHDTLAFDKAVGKAIDFYNEHPDETLIVVVGDHETGGMGLGFSKNYFLNLEALEGQKASFDGTIFGKYDGDREAYFEYIAEAAGLTNLTAKEKAEIEKAMDIVDSGAEFDVATYGPDYYGPVGIATTHVLSNRANIEWTTYAHSGTIIPFTAMGVGADEFAGYLDNTDIAKTMAEVMNFQLTK